MIKRMALSPYTALVTLLLLAIIRYHDPSFIEGVRLRYFDTLVASKTETVNNIYTVNIDEASLALHGQWPFDRRAYARIIEELYSRNAGLVVWTVLMPEADRQGGDGELAAVISRLPVVLSNVPGMSGKNQPRKVGASILNPEFIDRVIDYPGIIANIPQLEGPAAGVGISGTLPEMDGVTRRMPLIAGSGGTLYPSLGMEVLRVIAGDSGFQVRLGPSGVEKMRIPAFGPIATDNLGRVWIDFSQRSRPVSLADLPEDFGGAVVIVGTSAAGISNPVATSTGGMMPQDVHAAVVGTLYNKVSITRPDWADGAETIALVLLGVIIVSITRWTYAGIAGVAVLCVGCVIGSRWAYLSLGTLLDATALAGGAILVALHAYVARFVGEFLQKQQIKKQFGTYLSPDMVEKLQKDPGLLRLGGETRELSIMFTDVRGFTSISEHYGDDVQGLTKIMNRYMTAMTAKILDNRGTLDKYIGDAQMAFWNAPLDNPRHASDAVRTALEMLESLDAFNSEIAGEGVPPFGMGLGINTGSVVVGNMGSDQRFDYTCLGDSVNLASRLEGQSKPYHVAMVIGPSTHAQVRAEYPCLLLDLIAVKGKKEGTHIYTVLKASAEQAKSWGKAKAKHTHMMDDYFAQRFGEVVVQCKALKGSFNGQMDGYYDMWIERCTEMSRSPPGRDWDRVYRATSK